RNVTGVQTCALPICHAGNVEAYASLILENWSKQGITSLNELRKAEERIASANSSHSNSRAHKPYHEKLPEWAQEKPEKSNKKAKNVDRTATVDQDISRLMERIDSKKKKKGEKQHD